MFASNRDLSSQDRKWTTICHKNIAFNHLVHRVFLYQMSTVYRVLHLLLICNTVSAPRDKGFCKTFPYDLGR